MGWNDESDEETDEDATEFDASDPDADNTDECPHCGALIYDEAERCPECGEYLSREDAPAERRPLWVIAGAVICLVIVLLWVLGGLF